MKTIYHNYKDRIKTVSIDDDGYPEMLRLIDSPPQKLYMIGDEKLLKSRSIGVVGSRRCSEYGRQVAMSIGKAAAQNGITVVSGMAAGIDTAGHLGSLRGGGKTIAVLGSGIDMPYPTQNTNLYEEIARCGLVISEYPPGTHATVFTFPQRNRIISGLSESVVIVEAGTHSGALITAELAVNQGRQVFAVPGNITSPYSLGTNKLITDGASAIAVIDDIFTELGREPAFSKIETEDMGSDELAVLELLRTYGEITVDTVCDKLGWNVSKVSGILTIMEMKGVVTYYLGKIMVAKF